MMRDDHTLSDTPNQRHLFPLQHRGTDQAILPVRPCTEGFRRNAVVVALLVPDLGA